MATYKVEITSQVVGETEESLKMKPVWVLVDVETMTAKEIIARAVEEQINSLVPKNRKVDLKKARRMLVRQYMSQSDLEKEGLSTGPERPKDSGKWKQKVNVKKEIQRATDAFVEGRVVMIVNGEQVQDLEDQVVLKSDTKVKFIRLTPLVGG
jgi:hypothetical protein